MRTHLGLVLLAATASAVVPVAVFAGAGRAPSRRAMFSLRPSVPSPTAPRTSVVAIANGRQVSFARLAPTESRVVGLSINAPVGLEVNRGFGSTLSLSPDGTKLAFVRNRRAVVRDLAGMGPELEAPVFTINTGDAEPSFVGWSPDGSKLAVRLVAPATGDGPEPRLPAPLGYYVWSGPGAPPVRLTRAGEDLVYWSSDGASLLAHTMVSSSNYELRRVPIDNSAPSVLSTARLPYGYSQLHPMGDAMLYVRSEPGPTPGSTSNSYVALQNLDGSGLRHLGPDAAFADDQRPAFSPHRARFAYTHQPRNAAMEIMVGDVATGAPRSAYRCAQPCWFAWEAPDRMLVTDNGRLLRVPVQGEPTVIVPAGVQAVAVAGDG